ncbi:MAG: lamin tail domain-containing protein [bacterium]|nr:lamin tail domain-containing protein [bacterium]
MRKRLKNLIIFCGAFFIFAPLFVFAQENSFVLKEKQALDLVSIIRKYPLTDAQRDFYDQSIYDADSEYSIKTGAVMLVKQAILQSELDYWLVKMPAEFSKRFIKAVYKIVPAITVGDFSGIIGLIEKYTVEQANKYIDKWMKENKVQIGSGIGKYAFPSFKNNQQVINIPYIIVYSPTGVNKAKIVVEFYSQKPIEPPESRGSAEGNMDWATKTSWPKDRWITSKYNKNNKIEPFIVRVKGQVVKDKYGNFSWDKTVEVKLQQPSVEVEFGEAVPEIDQSDIILSNIQANQSQGFIKDKINEIKKKAQGIIDQVKNFFAIFKPTAQISSFVEPTGDSSPTPEVGKLPDLGGREDQQEDLKNLAQQSQEIADQAEQVVSEPENATTTYEDLLKIKADLEQAIKEKQAELDRLLALASLETPLPTGQATSTDSTSSPQAICSQATTQEPDFDKVIFNEVTWMGSTKSSSDEWIELKNISVKPIDLNGWQIFNKTQGLKIFFTTTTIVSPGGFFLLERTDDNTVPKIKADRIYTGALANIDEMLYLVNSNCVLQDKIKATPYWPEGDNTTKETMERNQFYGWQTSSVVGGTPKAKNSIGKSKPSSGSGSSSGSSKVVEVGLQQQNSTSTASSTEQATTTDSTSTSTGSVQATSSPQVLIVEIQITDGSSTHDFIKLFNQSTSTVVSLSGWQLKKKTSSLNSSLKPNTWRYRISPYEQAKNRK